MVQHIKDNGIIIKCKDKEHFLNTMEIYILVNSNKINSMEKENISIIIQLIIKASGKMIWKMDMDNKNIKMVAYIKEIIKMD